MDCNERAGRAHLSLVRIVANKHRARDSVEYDKLERAFAAGDTDAIFALRSLDFETFAPDGHHDSAENMKKYTRQWFENNQPPIEVHFTLTSFDIRSPNEVAVMTIQRASRYQRRDEKLRHVEHEVRQRETWVRTTDG